MAESSPRSRLRSGGLKAFFVFGEAPTHDERQMGFQILSVGPKFITTDREPGKLINCHDLKIEIKARMFGPVGSVISNEMAGYSFNSDVQ